MLITISEVLSKAQVDHCRKVLSEATWEDGRTTAGVQSSTVKHNQQLPQGSAASEQLGQLVLEALAANATFISAAIPMRIFPPLFNSYSEGQEFGLHVDNAIRAVPGTPVRIRTDVSCTLFLAEPDEYDGGELVIEDQFGSQEIKLPAGDLVVYPSSSLHKVNPVLRGTRLASFFWLQSMVRSAANRAMLFELDQSIQELAFERGIDDAVCVRLSGIYHNLIRAWAEA